MKRLEILRILAILILAIDSYEASLIARGRSKTKKIAHHISETSFSCLDPPINLPACNFKAETNEELLKRPSRHTRSLKTLAEGEQSIEETEVINPTATVIIYKIEGCIPSRLPFVLPLCKTEDSAGKIVEVRRLFPFKVTGPLAQESGVSAPLVFPEVDMNQWQRLMQGAWTRHTNNEDETAETKIVSQQIAENLQSEITKEKAMKRKKFYQANINEKKNKNKFTKTSKEIGESKIFSKFPSPFAVERQQLTNDRAGDTDSYKNKSSRLNRIDADASQTKNGEISEELEEKAFSTQHHHEFPYAKAIPFDAEKLRNSQLAIENPRGVIDDPEKLRISSVGTEFPYHRAIPFNAEKLGVARRGSEFPFNRAIPYDPKELLERRKNAIQDGPSSSYPLSSSLKHEEARTKPDPRDVPFDVYIFDVSMLDAAREGRIFPYVKATPRNTAKIADTMELRRSNDPEKIQVPVKHGGAYRDEDFRDFKKKTQDRKDQARMERIWAGRELEENLISAWNSEIEPFRAEENFEVPQPSRITRRAAEPVGSGDAPSGSTKINRRWIEFPYSKAIDFEPGKLGLSKSSV